MPDDTPTAFPLKWPAGYPRTPPGRREQPKFRTSTRQPDSHFVTKNITMADARRRLANELDRLRARFVVLSTNVELRLDGQPRSDAPAPADPGVAVYFQLANANRVICCDRWRTVAGNIAAIAAHIDAMRGQERWGCATVERMFDAFLALPAPLVVDDWRAVLGNPERLDHAKAVRDVLLKKAHPDVGGSHAEAARINAAYQMAEAFFISKARERPS